MRGSVAKVLRRLFMENYTGDAERAGRRYELVQHLYVSKKAKAGIYKGGFPMCRKPRMEYLMAKNVFKESNSKERRQMMVQAMGAIEFRLNSQKGGAR